MFCLSLPSPLSPSLIIILSSSFPSHMIFYFPFPVSVFGVFEPTKKNIIQQPFCSILQILRAFSQNLRLSAAMCDFFDRSSPSPLHQQTTKSMNRGDTKNEQEQMPDMDELLDQLELDSSHHYQQYFGLKQKIESVNLPSTAPIIPPSPDAIRPLPKPRSKFTANAETAFEELQSPAEVMADEPDLEQKEEESRRKEEIENKEEEEETRKDEEEKMREAEEKSIVESMLDERLEELTEIEKLEMLENLDRKEEEEEEADQRTVMEQSSSSSLHNNGGESGGKGQQQTNQEGKHKSLKGVLETKKGEEKMEELDVQMEDIFAQIDKMDAQIRAEGSGYVIEEGSERKQDTKSDVTSPIQHASSDQFYALGPCSATENLEQFVGEMVDQVLYQVLADQAFVSHPSKRQDGDGESATAASESETNKIGEEEERRANEEDGEAKFEEDQPCPSSSSQSTRQPSSASPKTRRSPLATVHDLSAALDEFKLTESELMLGKKKPYWIPDEDCPNCMLCSLRFSIVNRRHHCRACGRVLCRSCCTHRRQLIYMDGKEGKQRVCSPCNRTLDRIDEYELRLAAARAEADSEAADLDDELSQLLTGHINQQNDLSNPIRRPSADDSNTHPTSLSSAISANKPKKSLLKQPGSARRPSTTDAITDPNNSEVSEKENTGGNDGQQPNVATTSIAKRSVTFRDGVNPGQDSRPNSIHGSNNTLNSSSNNSNNDAQPASSSSYQWLIRGGSSSASGTSGNASTAAKSSSDNGDSSSKKLPRKLSRRSRERRIEEEGQSLLTANQPERIWMGEQREDGVDELVQRELAEFVRNLLMGGMKAQSGGGGPARIALRRNFHLRLELTKVNEQPVLSACTQGLAAIGVDELLLLLQLDSAYFSKDLKIEMLALLEQFDQIFQHCLDPQEDSTLDHQMGIRKCISRMARLYPLPKKKTSLFGHKAASILFHRPHGQFFTGLHTPNGPFLVGVLIRQEEHPWAMCVPSRILLRLGMLRGEYPFPIVNVHRDHPVFTATAVQSSVLKVLNDFRHWNYRMARLPGTAVAIRDHSTDVVLPEWLLDEVRPLVESNRNMIGWALSELSPDEANLEIDSHLTCVQEGEGPTCFSTRIFTPDLGTIAPRKATGASFVIFDGALKGGEQLLVSLVEDGVVIRLHADLMEELVKSLLSGDSFSATNEQGHRLTVYFRSNDNANTSNNRAHQLGALVSPIDERPLSGQFQYGLVLTRQLRSLNFFQFSPEWALRISAVINILPGKFPSALQPRFFEVCEQLAAHVAPTLEPFLQELITFGQRSVALRVRVEEEAISYETEKWPTLPDQHFVWTVTLDEQIIPFLYALCAWVPNGFFVELHMPIVSTRPLPALTVPADA